MPESGARAQLGRSDGDGEWRKWLQFQFSVLYFLHLVTWHRLLSLSAGTLLLTEAFHMITRTRHTNIRNWTLNTKFDTEIRYTQI